MIDANLNTIYCEDIILFITITVALVCKSEPTLSHLWCDALPVELPSPWEQGGGEEGIQV